MADDFPDADTCNRLCKEFAEITGTDSACGHFFLQDCDWNLEIALGQFFQRENVGGRATGSSSKTDTEKIIVRKDFKLLSWNIDGLDDKNRSSRTKAVSSLIKRETPSVVFFQEVIDETFAILKEELNDDYLLIPSNDQQTDYFTAVLLRRETTKCSAFNVTTFPSSQMLRSLLQVEADVFGKPFVFLTTHLESTKSFATERVKQLKICLQTIKNLPSNKTIVFGGDLNLRDSELASIEEDLPEGLVDAWQSRGSKKDVQFTWDCLKNDNIQMNGKYKPRCRFDRIFVKASDPQVTELVNFRLVGLERVRSCLCFPSDHFGICCEFIM